MDKNMLTALVNRKERGKQKAKKKRPHSPPIRNKSVKKIKLSSSSTKAAKKVASTERPTAVPQKTIFDLAMPEPAIRITEVNLANAPNTKKDHDYRPVMFAGCMDLEGRHQVEEALSAWVQPLSEHPEHLTSHIIIPAKAHWFNRSAIHAIEKSSLNEFFNESSKAKTADTYTAYRNYMIDTYRSAPQRYLTCVECRRKLPGDLCSIFRVHSFLEHWGLINYGLTILNNQKPSRLLLPHTDAHFYTLTDTETGTHPAEPQRKSYKNSAGDHCVDFYSDDEPDQPDNSEELEENSNTSVMNNLGIQPKDIEVDRSQSVMIDYRDWTDQEVLRLMEGVEKYRDDWNKIGEHVGSRNQDECLLYFMRLPIEEKFTNKDSPFSHADNVIPFGRSCNPVMYTMSFLANVVNAKVAASAAKAALEVFSYLKDPTEPVTPEKIVERHIRSIKAAMDGEGAQDVPPATSAVQAVEPETDWTSYSHTDRRVIKRALDKALEAAAAKSLELAQHDELKIKAGVALLVNKQTKKLTVKMNYLESINAKLESSTRKLHRQRQVLLAEREAYHQTVLDEFGLEARATALIEAPIQEEEDKNLMGDNPVFVPFGGEAIRPGKLETATDDVDLSKPVAFPRKADPFGFDDPTSPKTKNLERPSKVEPNTDSPLKTETLPKPSPILEDNSVIKPEAVSPLAENTLKEEEVMLKTETIADPLVDAAAASRLLEDEETRLSSLPAAIPEFHDDTTMYHTYSENLCHRPSFLDEDLTVPLTGAGEIDMSNEDNQAAALLDFS